MDSFLNGMKTGNVFLSVKKYDEPNYAKLLDKLSEIAKGYFEKADTRLVRAYLETYAGFLASTAESGPLSVCKLENPQAFGSPGGDIVRLMDEAGIFEQMDEVIRSAITAPVDFPEAEAQGGFNVFIAEYASAHPEHLEVLGMQISPEDDANVRRLAQAYIDIYKDLIALDPDESANIYKLMRLRS